MGCSIDDNTAIRLAALPHYNNVLRELWLQVNDIGQQGARELSTVLKSNKSLETLSLLGCSSITSSGAMVLVNCLHDNSSLKRLQLSEAYKSDCSKEPDYSDVEEWVEWCPDITQQSTVKMEKKSVNCEVLGKSLVQ